MPSARHPRDVACPTCHATWPRRSARFCGRCGGSLTPTEASTERVGASGLRSTRAVAGTAAATLLVVAVTATMLLGGRDDQAPPPSDPGAVALPDPGDVRPSQDADTPTDGAPSGGSATDPVGRDLPTVRCLHGPCARWSTPLPQGQVVDVGGLLLHVERKVGPPTDWPDEGREEPSRDYAILTAVDPADGTIVWTRELRLPHLTDRDVQALRTSGLIVIAWDHKVVAVNERTGERSWTHHLDPGVHLVHPGRNGDILVWRADEPGDDEVAHDPSPGGGAAATVPGELTSLSLANGASRWQTEATPVLVTGTRLVSMSRDGTTLHGVDLLDGSYTWSRELPSLGEARPVALTEDRALVRSTQRLEVLDLGSGETLTGQAATTSMAVTAVDTTAFVHPSGLRPTELRSAAAPTPVYVHDLTDPAGTATQIRDVVAVRPLGNPARVLPGSWRQLPAAGAAIVRQWRTEVEVTLLGPDGEVSIDAEAGLSSERCCWQLLPGSDVDGLVFRDPDAVAERIVVLSTDDLTRRVTLNLPQGMEATGVARSEPLLLTIHGGDGVGQGLWLASADGLAGMPGSTELVTVTPRTVVMTDDGLVGLDPG